MKTTHHYTYYSYEEWGRGYIGVRSCDCLPEEDIEYFGSFTDTSFNPNQKIILKSNYETRREASEDEIILHDFYDVAKNPHFANRAKATSTGFDTTGSSFSLTNETRKKISLGGKGKTRTEETKQKIRKARTGKTHTDETKQKCREASTGKTHTEEAKNKISEAIKGEKHPNFGKSPTKEATQKNREAHTGEKNPMFGKTHTDETKRLMREAARSSKVGEKVCASRWEDPGHPEIGVHNPGNLVKTQKRLGLPHGKENRRKIG
jgi:hypothetical protein